MAWIEESKLPDVPAIFQAMSLKPEALDAVKRLNEVLSFGNSGLSRVQEEGIATVVSVANRCRYGAMTHAGFLRRHSQDQELASHFLCDYTNAPLSVTDRSILDFAVQVTQAPSALTEDDVEQLREAGLDESQILSVVLVACLANFMDRLANSLGVDLEPRQRQALGNWLTGPAAQQDWLVPSPVQPPASASTKSNLATTNGNAVLGGDSRSESPIRPEEGPDDPEPDVSPPMETDIPGALEDLINSGFLTNGSTSTQDVDEDAILSHPSSGGDADGLEDVTPGSDVGGEHTTGIELSGGQDGGAEEATIPPDSETQENVLEEETAAQNSGGEPVEHVPEEPESSPPVDVNPFIGRFVEECCETDDANSATARELYIAYLRWSDENDQQPLRQRDFGINLSEMGFHRQRKARGRHWWVGIALVPQDTNEIKGVHTTAIPSHRIN